MIPIIYVIKIININVNNYVINIVLLIKCKKLMDIRKSNKENK